MAKRRKYIEIKIYVVYMWFSLRYLENNFIHFSNTNRCLLQWGFFWMYCVPFQNFSTLIRRFKNICPLYIVLIKMMESADIKRQDIRRISRCPTRQYANITGCACSVLCYEEKNSRVFFLPCLDDNASD